MIKVGGDFIATTAPITPDFGSGSSWTFTGMPPLASIINYGSIQAGNGRSLFLIAENIQNNGSLNAPGGNIGLAAGQTVLVSERPDGRGLSASVRVPAGAVNNLGQITADAGMVELQAQVVNQNGIIQANSVQNQNGVIELIASDQLTLGANSQIIANGDNSPDGSAGGNVTLQSGDTFSDIAGSQITVHGGAQGGNGGSVEISAPDFLSLNSSLDASAQAGSAAGQLLLNSQDITLNASGANGMNGGTLDLNVNGTFANFSQIILQASGATATGSGNITLAAGNGWDLGAGSGQLTLEAAGDITFGNGSQITDANHWSATLAAGYNFANNTVRSGVGNIYLNGVSGAIQLSQSSISLTAGNSIVIGSGSRLIDDGGTIGLYAPTVDQDGLIQANSVGNQHGIIELVADDLLTLGANSQITANGDNSSSGSAGGQIMVQTAQTFSDVSGSLIEALGGANGGDGGRILVYAAPGSFNSQLDVSAQAGSAAGGKYFYPRVDTLTLTAASLAPFAGFSHILFQANDDITIAAGATLNLSGTAGSRTSGQLTLAAGDSLSKDGNIIFGAGSKITDANDWSVTLEAGYNFANQAVQSGVGNIYLNGGSGLTTVGTIQLAAGDINLFAGQSILVAPMGSTALSGSIFTTAGGNIFAYAMAGDIIAGTSNGGTGPGSSGQTSDYNFTDSGATPNTVLGGISTAAGGNVTLIAGNNIDSTPYVQRAQAPGASGAYGSGDVTIIAGNQITGNYNLADGVGTMIAGVPVPSSQAAILQKPGADAAAYAATLGDLVAAVKQSQNAKGNIGTPPDPSKTPSYSSSPVTLSVIDGTWNAWAANDISLKEVNNPNGAFNTLQSFLFDNAPDAAANFWAGNAIELIGANLGRLTSANKTPIYAPILSLNAGAGGLKIDKSIILAPSSEGSLTIITRDGGDLSGAVIPGSTVLNGIIMSDGNPADYQTFAAGHDSTPLHLNDPNPNPVVLDISGSVGNFGLVVPTFAQITVDSQQPFTTSAGGSFYGAYNFAFSGQNLSPLQTTFIHVTGGDIAYPDYTPGATFGGQGLALAGPGNFDISARNIDLGFAGGISVLAPDAALAAISPYGANLTITTAGNLDMISTSIANYSLLGGITLNVGVDAGGILNVGGTLAGLGDPNVVRGIFTTSGGNLFVTAGGNVDVEGSRIAAYNGGNIEITSKNGDINAGSGGSGYVTFSALELVKPNPNDPTTWYLRNIPSLIPWSGILATTVPGSDAALGNITINAPKGSVDAGLGGIIGLAFNGVDSQNSLIDVNAGLDIIASGSGIIGANIAVIAGRTLSGSFIARHHLTAKALNYDRTFLFGQHVDYNQTGPGEGIPIVISDNPVIANGIELPDTAPDVPNAPKEVAQTADDATTVASKTDDQTDSDEDLQKKKGKGIALAQKTSRVTIILPPKQPPKAQTPDPRT
jgi:hypothetical protein